MHMHDEKNVATRTHSPRLADHPNLAQHVDRYTDNYTKITCLSASTR